MLTAPLLRALCGTVKVSVATAPVATPLLFHGCCCEITTPLLTRLNASFAELALCAGPPWSAFTLMMIVPLVMRQHSRGGAGKWKVWPKCLLVAVWFHCDPAEAGPRVGPRSFGSGVGALLDPLMMIVTGWGHGSGEYTVRCSCATSEVAASAVSTMVAMRAFFI